MDKYIIAKVDTVARGKLRLAGWIIVIAHSVSQFTLDKRNFQYLYSLFSFKNILMKAFIILSFIFLTTSSFSQHQPVPDYLTTQAFPDSVKTVSLIQPDGTSVSFADMLQLYKGKKVVIDIWASWCRDCLVGLPKLEALKQKTGTADVIYVFLSVDKDDPKWKTAINRYNIQGEHYRVEGGWKTPLSNYIVLDWVPRYLVLDESGMIIMPKAIHVDDATLEKVLTGDL
ncbi:MAG TPA: TlpA disulfide reductase family protein [Ohtaekwangia sp.]|nr:TlpA disulfide reductase family protein [Ohtaekwangia sp.]